VAARCAFARAGVGAVASQNITDPTLGPQALDLMAGGKTAEAAIAILAGTAPYIQYRQLTAIDARGGTAVFSGEHALGINAVSQGRDCVAAGNLLAQAGVPGAMTAAFEAAEGHLADRMIAAMQAAVAAGGEAGSLHSAGLLLVRDQPWPVADLRVDWHESDPIGGLAALWEIYKPQLDDYVTRALDPTAAPRYGVPGDT
jgi:uncharacterized Ntn-hydrolase superfamily protein